MPKVPPTQVCNYMHVHKIALGVAFLKTVSATASACLHQHRLKAELVAFASELMGTVKMLQAVQGGQLPSESADEDETPWMLSITDMVTWVNSVEVLVQRFRRFMVGAMLADTYTLAEQLTKDTPQYGHYISDDAYRSTLAKRNLLNYTKTESLTQDSVLLFRLLQEISTLFRDFGLGKAVTEGTQFGESVACCQSAFRGAKRALTVVAAVQVIEGPKSQATKDSAGALLKKKGDLPTSMIPLLEHVAGIPQRAQA